MNTIPIIFNEHEVPYTVVGDKKKDSESDKPLFSVVILNRSARFFSDSIFQNLKLHNFQSIFCISNVHTAANIEKASEIFPEIKFITPLENVTVGEMINICVSESKSEYVLVLWDDTTIEAQGFAATMLEQLYNPDRICTAPTLLSYQERPLLNQIVPSLQENNFSTQQLPVIKDKTSTVYPFDFIGIYNRKKIIEVGGFDYTIKNPYWQILDFGMRAKFWGHEIKIATSFKVKYISSTPTEDITADESYRIFFLKNLAHSMENNEAVLKKRFFLNYKKKSGLNFFDALHQFNAAKAWISLNKNRFQKSAHELVTEWEPVT